MAKMAELLLSDSTTGIQDYLTPESARPSHDSLPERRLISPSNDGERFIVYNPLGRRRREVLSIVCSTNSVKVEGPTGVVQSQASPMYDGKNSNPISGKYEVWFATDVPALGLATYTITQVAVGSNEKHSIASGTSGDAFSGSHIELKTKHTTARFNKQSGFLEQLLQTKNGRVKSTEIAVEFMQYGVGRGKDHNSPSGAYLFMPDGDARSYSNGAASTVRVIQGELVSQVDVVMDQVHHTVRLFAEGDHSVGTLAVKNIVDVTQMSNAELVMRIKTNVENNNKFYTDLNGFQMRQRIEYDKIPMGGNFFPLSGMGFLEDDSQRVSVHTRSSLGCAALKQGWFEVVLDRTMSSDDNRGLFQGIRDNRVTLSEFVFSAEFREEGKRATKLKSTSYPSLYGNAVNDALNYPAYIFVRKSSSSSNVALAPSFSAGSTPSDADLPCDVHLVNLRSIDTETDNVADIPGMLLLLQRKGYVCGFDSMVPSCRDNTPDKKVNLQKVLSKLNIKESQVNLAQPVTIPSLCSGGDGGSIGVVAQVCAMPVPMMRRIQVCQRIVHHAPLTHTHTFAPPTHCVTSV